MLVVVVYDIPEDKRRTKLSNFLEGYGRRVQYSVFECFLSLEEMRQLYEEVKKLVKPAEDHVRFYWISHRSGVEGVNYWRRSTPTAAKVLCCLGKEGR